MMAVVYYLNITGPLLPSSLQQINTLLSTKQVLFQSDSDLPGKTISPELILPVNRVPIRVQHSVDSPGEMILLNVTLHPLPTQYLQESFTGKLSAVHGTGVFNTPTTTTTSGENGDTATSGGDTAGDGGDIGSGTVTGDKVGDYVTLHEVEWAEGEFMVK
jgi:hypothetical protein